MKENTYLLRNSDVFWKIEYSGKLKICRIASNDFKILYDP